MTNATIKFEDIVVGRQFYIGTELYIKHSYNEAKKVVKGYYIALLFSQPVTYQLI